MTPDQKLTEELIDAVRRMTCAERLALRDYIAAQDKHRQEQIATFVHTTMAQLVSSPPPIPVPESPDWRNPWNHLQIGFVPSGRRRGHSGL